MANDQPLVRCETCGEIRPLTVDCAACGKSDGKIISGELLHAVQVCAGCCAGLGAKCETPGCAFWMHDAPEARLLPTSGGIQIRSERMLAYEELRRGARIVAHQFVSARAGQMNAALLKLDELDIQLLPEVKPEGGDRE